jgi:FtsP/CotA-like multicopper oxidase with cupredoxin domain
MGLACSLHGVLQLRHVSCGLLLALAAACSSGTGGDDECTPDDADGVVGGHTTVLVSVSDTGYAVGGVNSGSMQPNIAVQNSSTVTLTLTNTGTTPHGFQIACIPTDLPAGCPQKSCFPDNASVSELAPGDSITVTFTTPAVEGAYSITSDQPGDAELLGQFVLT